MSLWIKNCLALLLLAVLFLIVDIGEIWKALANLSLLSVALLLLMAGALILVSAVKWRLFLENVGAKVRLAQLFGLYLVGYFVNLLMPSYVGGDVVRSYYIGKHVGQAQALGATILERYTGLVAMLALGLIFAPFVSSITWQIELALFLLCLGVAVLTVMAQSEKCLAWLGHIPHSQVLIAGLTKIQLGFQLARKNRRLLVQAFLLSFLYHTLTVGNTLIAAWAVGWENPPVRELFVVLPLILLIGALPVTPQGLGIQEGAFSYFLHGIGATPAQALSLALVLRAKSYVLALCGWLVWLRVRGSGNLPPQIETKT